jgi:hypothetical protein
MASRPTGASGVSVCPTVVTATMPMPAPVAASSPRRVSPGVFGAGDGPALLYACGSRSRHFGEDVSVGDPDAEAVLDVGQFDGDVQQDRADDDVGQEPCTGTKLHGHGYQFSALKNPVNSCTNDDDTSTATEARSSACLTERIGGQRTGSDIPTRA